MVEVINPAALSRSYRIALWAKMPRHTPLLLRHHPSQQGVDLPGVLVAYMSGGLDLSVWDDPIWP